MAIKNLSPMGLSISNQQICGPDSLYHKQAYRIDYGRPSDNNLDLCRTHDVPDQAHKYADYAPEVGDGL